MACLKPPFSGDNQLSVALNINNAGYDPLPSQYSKELSRVILWCLNKNPTLRPTIDDLINVPEVSRRLREKRLTDNSNHIKKRQEEVVKK
jgi:serine/threonine protein kinase